MIKNYDYVCGIMVGLVARQVIGAYLYCYHMYVLVGALLMRTYGIGNTW